MARGSDRSADRGPGRSARASASVLPRWAAPLTMPRWDRGRSFDEAAAEGLGHRARSIAGVQLYQDALEVALHRPFRDHDRLRDLGVGLRVGDELEHLLLASGHGL